MVEPTCRFPTTCLLGNVDFSGPGLRPILVQAQAGRPVKGDRPVAGRGSLTPHVRFKFDGGRPPPSLGTGKIRQNQSFIGALQSGRLAPSRSAPRFYLLIPVKWCFDSLLPHPVWHCPGFLFARFRYHMTAFHDPFCFNILCRHCDVLCTNPKHFCHSAPYS